MKEMNARLSIMAVDDLTAAQKLIMLYLLTRVDWDTWQGSVSANDIEQGTAQSKRNIKRSLKTLEELSYISREITRRDTGLHHKALVKVNVSKIGDRKSPPIVTESHHPRQWGSDKKSPPVVTECAESSDRKSPPVVTKWPRGGDRKSPNNNIDQYNNNINQSIINREVTPKLEVREAAETWDDAFSKHELEEITEEFRDGLWYVSRVDDMLEYRREVHRQCTHHNRRDVRDALLLTGGLLPQMARELIAPRSAIDWCTLQAAGELPSVPTPAAPPKPSQVITVTVQDQQRMKEVDQAWSVGSYDMKGDDGW